VKPAVLNECDRCRQNCTDLLAGNCCVQECTRVTAVPVPVPVPVIPPVPPISPDAVPCD
jgi:hypothetical protein